MTNELDDFLCEVKCEEVYVDHDEDEEEDQWSDYDGLPDSDEDSILIDENGGITAEGYALLNDLEKQGFFV